MRGTDGRLSDVFISYAHSTTAQQARAAADALRAAGYSVWLDDDLPAHRAFSREIDAQLTAAKAALVIWSAEAAMSDWVLSEADRARSEHKLVQLRLDGARLPMPFDQIQCADLSDWTGDSLHPGWAKVVSSVAELVGRRPKRRRRAVASGASLADPQFTPAPSHGRPRGRRRPTTFPSACPAWSVEKRTWERSKPCSAAPTWRR